MIKNQKGISLIVLVITIIVMIIIAGAIILSLSNGNVIVKAKIAKESNDFTGIREMVEMEKGNAMFPGATFDKTKTPIPSAYANDIFISNIGGIFLLPNANSKIYETENAMDKLGAAYLPSGFEHVTGNIAEGIVIKNSTDGNEFVWIPVTGTLERKAFLGENLTTTFTEDIGTAYDLMKTSVEKYNGFYVSRYEAGKPTGTGLTEGTTTGLDINGTDKPVSKAGAEVWNNIPFAISGNIDTNDGAAKVSKQAYAGSSVVSSSLLYGAQYDAMLTFINSTSTSVTNSTTWGNHNNSTFTFTGQYQVNGSGAYTSGTGTTKPANTSWLLTTGASEQNKAKNIYDVAGNVREWTYELYPAGSNRVIRSGYFNYSVVGIPAADRSIVFPDGSFLSEPSNPQIEERLKANDLL